MGLRGTALSMPVMHSEDPHNGVVQLNQLSVPVVEADNQRRNWSTYKWIPTSMKSLELAELKLFKYVKCALVGRFVPVKAGQCQIWTVMSKALGNELATVSDSAKPNQVLQGNNSSSKSVPLVLIHGFGGGTGFWLQNYETLSKDRTVYSFDLLGFGRSSRPVFSSDPAVCETEWVQSIEEWRREVKLDKFILCGHSLGGYLAAAYAIEYPGRVRHLILADPWGFPTKPPNNQGQQIALPAWVRVVASIASYFNPLATLRLLGPFGPHLVRKLRPDLRQKFLATVDDEDAVFDYIYHCNVQSPSGEVAFRTLSIPFGWAKRPMMERISLLKPDVPISFIYGSRSWIDSGPGYRVQHELRPNSYVSVDVIRGAGHHIYADKPEEFNNLVKNLCAGVDKNSFINSAANSSDEEK